jgi:hypothetical protein
LEFGRASGDGSDITNILVGAVGATNTEHSRSTHNGSAVFGLGR